ncbi:MAG: LysE family transporter [Myxococcota bacterium]
MTSLLAFATVYMLGLASPGPDFVLTVRNSLLFARTTGVWTAAGLALAVGVHMVGCVLGIGLLAARFPLLLRGLQLGGAAYLAALGVGLLYGSRRQTPRTQPVTRSKTPRPWRAVSMGFLCNLLNPKAAVFFWALWAELAQAAIPLSRQIACAVFAVISTFAWFALVAMVLSTPVVRQRFVARQHWIARVSGAALLCFALGMGFVGSSSPE